MRSMLAAMAALGLAAGTGAASAQNSLAGEPVIGGVSADTIVALFGSAGMPGVVVGASGEDQLVELRSSDGFVMYVGLSNCASQASSAPCALVKPYAIFNSGAPLENVNHFNYSVSSVATLMVMGDGRLLLGVKVLLDGGVTMSNLRAYLASFMYDAAALLEGPEDSMASNVAYRPEGIQGPAPGVVPAAGAQANPAGADPAAAAHAAAALSGGSK